MLAFASSALAQTADDSPIQLPYKCTFESAEQLSSEWSIVNNGDYVTWEWADWPSSPDGTTGVASCPTNSALGNNDWMISRPLTLEAGTNHVTFAVRGVRADGPEVIELCIGTSEDPEKMKTLKSWTVKSKEWQQKAVNFEVEETGTYRLALRSLSKNGYNTYVDDFTADKGEMVLTPELKLESIRLPYSQCDYSEQTIIGVTISNNGNGPAKGITMTYTVNGGKKVTEAFEDVTLQPDGNITLYFKTLADMSAAETYTIEATAAGGGNIAAATATVTHKETLRQLPANSSFADGESDNWEGHSAGSWTYDRMGQYITTKMRGEDNGLFSRCIYTDTPVRLKFAYTGGMFTTKGSMKVLMGLSGTDISTWKTVYEDKAVDRDGAEKEISVSDIEPGFYTFAVINTSEATDVPLNLYYINISGIYDYDIRATETRTAMAAYTPAEQYNSKGKYSMTVENRGTKAVNKVAVSVNIGNDKCFSQEIETNINPGETGTLTIEGTMPEAAPGQEIKGVSLTAGIEGEKYEDDNKIELDDIEVTDTLFATENVKEFVRGIGLNYQTARFGNVYTLNTADTLTSVTLGLAEDPNYKKRDIGISVYAVGEDGHTIGRSLLQITAERGVEGGLRTFTFEPRLLQAGNYYVEAQQITPENIGIAYDADDEKSVFYQSDGTKLYAIKGSGAIALRMNFGHGATLHEHNAQLREFTAPLKDKGLYGKEDSVGVTLSNIGTEEIKGMRMTCSIDGEEKASKTVSLLPYETKEVMFNGIDLSAAGEHTITVNAMLDNDENTQDNTLTRTVTAVAEANPYKMDFEQCDDFDYGTMLNPRWRTVDRTGEPTNGWAYYDYPHKGEPVGFIAFNTEATTPAITNIPGFYAHSGKRFGAAFATGLQTEITESDVWLISPQLALNDKSSMKLFVKTYGIEMYNKPERYRLLVSDTDDDFSSFTVIGGDREAAADEWEEVNVDLSQYDNKNVYIALQYISNSKEGVVMMVDDIEVSTGATGIISGQTDANNIKVSAEGGNVHITATQPLTSVKLFSLSGLEIYSCNTASAHSHIIPAQTMPSGIYIVKAKTAGGERIFKLKL